MWLLVFTCRETRIFRKSIVGNISHLYFWKSECCIYKTKYNIIHHHISDFLYKSEREPDLHVMSFSYFTCQQKFQSRQLSNIKQITKDESLWEKLLRKETWPLLTLDGDAFCAGFTHLLSLLCTLGLTHTDIFRHSVCQNISPLVCTQVVTGYAGRILI